MDQIKLGGFTLVGLGGNMAQVDFLNARAHFVEHYCAEQGWDVSHLNLAQVIQIREQDGWKNPSVKGK